MKSRWFKGKGSVAEYLKTECKYTPDEYPILCIYHELDFSLNIPPLSELHFVIVYDIKGSTSGYCLHCSQKFDGFESREKPQWNGLVMKHYGNYTNFQFSYET